MSRNHAILRADPVTRVRPYSAFMLKAGTRLIDNQEFTVEDTGSMHGTQCNGNRLRPKAPELIFDHDMLVFGADVTRGSGMCPLSTLLTSPMNTEDHPAQFRALKVTVTPLWSDQEYATLSYQSLRHSYSLRYRGSDHILPVLPSFRNTFTADYSEEELYDDEANRDHIYNEDPANAADFYDETTDDHPKDSSIAKAFGEHGNWVDYSEDEPLDVPEDDVEIIKESIRAASVEMVIPQQSRSFHASDSDQGSSYFSEGEDGESPTSSPTGLNDERTDSVIYDTFTKALNAQVVDLAQEEEEEEEEEAAGASDIPAAAYPRSERSQHSQLELKAHHENPDREDAMKSQQDRQALTVSDLGSVYDAGETATNKSLAQLRPLDAARAPSPSEVAMVKSTSDTPHQQPLLQQPPAHDEPPLSYHMDMPGRETNWGGAGWDLYNPGIPLGPLPLTVPDLSYLPEHYISYGINPTPSYACPTASTSAMHTGPLTLSSPARSREAKSVPKCSISQILEQPKNAEEQERSSTSKSLKRKADEMFNATEDNQSTEGHASFTLNDASESSMKRSGVLSQVVEPESNMVSIPVADAAAKRVPGMAPEETESHPRKKVKKDQAQSNDRGNFMKIAAATITGVAIGTVGTIIGLASLPQDYFL